MKFRCIIEFVKNLLRQLTTVLFAQSFVVSAGSRYWQSGSFEVSKADSDNKDSNEPTAPSPQNTALRVTILSELEGVAYIQVAIRELAPSGGKEWRLQCKLILGGSVFTATVDSPLTVLGKLTVN
jgi:hypothetical protein